MENEEEDEILLLESDDDEVQFIEELGPDDDDHDSNSEEEVLSYLHTETPLNKHLIADVQACCSSLKWFERDFSVPAAEIRTLPSDELAIDLRLALGTLPQHLLRAWQLNEDLFLVITLHGVSKALYRCTSELPRISVTRLSTKESFSIGKQLEMIASKVIKDTYPLPADAHELMAPDLYGSFLCSLHSELCLRLPNLSEFCMICDHRLPASGLLPSICKEEMCVFQYDEVGLCRSLATISITPEVLDLLITFLMAAAHSPRLSDQLLDPYPVIRSDWNVLFYGNKCLPSSKEFRTLQSDLIALPCAKRLTKPDFLVDMRSEKMSLARLVTWTISSNRAYIVPLPAIYRIAMMTTDHQYLTVVDSPAKQERFMTLKAANGNRSQFVFHGSPIQNWHSILHNGLVVASGTQKQINGAAYGTGIYLCTDPTYSYRYSIGHSVTPPAPMKCEEECCTKTGAVRYARDARIVLSICEVVDNPTVLKKHHGIWVLTDSDYVCVRLLFVYLNATAAAGPTVQGIDAQGMQSIRSAIELFGGDDFDTKMRLLYGSGNETEEGEDESDNTPCAAKRVKKQ